MSSSDKPVMGVKEGVKRWAVAAAAATVAESSTIPLDVAKTRLQLQNELRGKVGGGKPYRGMIGTLAGVYREEGPRALFRGLPAAVIRQTVYGGIGVGMYQPVRNALVPAGAEPTLAHKVMAGAITGGVGSALATPTDVVKVRHAAVHAACAQPTHAQCRSGCRPTAAWPSRAIPARWMRSCASRGRRACGDCIAARCRPCSAPW